MKKLFTYLLLSSAMIMSLSVSVLKADGADGDKSTDLSEQIVQEIREALETPYLKYETKDLTGKVTVYTVVDKNGRIMFAGLKGLNEDLISNVNSKLNSLNLWTSPDYVNKVFKYDINYRN
ncbi:MAG: hypothetical protein IPM38_04220 [Ignavibacteria bacterium]|nr:hypothetical protein [Ignavibacteria bacterium]